jgi:hypothetical protein
LLETGGPNFLSIDLIQQMNPRVPAAVVMSAWREALDPEVDCEDGGQMQDAVLHLLSSRKQQEE